MTRRPCKICGKFYRDNKLKGTCLKCSINTLSEELKGGTLIFKNGRRTFNE